ncbi:hypothetical protein K9M42_02760, partial [Patescibacteria group bacterium]|nr:hypothetical protein [Patescibacteria group bacterium]
MSKVNISPQIGSIDLSTKIDITVNNLSTDYSKRISIENVTNNVYALIENDKYFIIDKDKNSISFTVDLNVVENNTSSLISFFIYIENFIDGEYKLVDIIPANFTLLNENVEEFLFNIKIDPLFINIDEISNIKIDIDKKDKVIVSINDRLFNILSNEDGVGELSFRGKEVIDTEINSMQCFPIYIYTSESNFTKKIFTGYTLSILPSNVKV